MKGRLGKSEAAALRLSEAARTVLMRAAFDGNGWSLRLFSDEVTNELMSAKLARETANGRALTDLGMRVRAAVVRLSHRKASLSVIAISSYSIYENMNVNNKRIVDLTAIMLAAKIRKTNKP